MAESPGTASAAVSNAALVDLGDRTLVVDTFMTAAAAAELAEESKRLTGRLPFLVVNSHWHGDHIGGNRVFHDAAIVGTARMRELIAGDAPASRDEFEKEANDIRVFAERAAAKAETNVEKANASGLAALADALISDPDGHRVVLPSVLVGSRLDVVGERRATILGHGRGHTESDLFVHLPDDGVVIAGDLVWTGMHPKTDDGYPSEWAEVLDRIAELGVERVVPGHGPPGGGADVTAMARYLRAVETVLSDVRAGNVAPSEVGIPQGSEDWQGPRRFQVGVEALVARSTDS